MMKSKSRVGLAIFHHLSSDTKGMELMNNWYIHFYKENFKHSTIKEVFSCFLLP